MDESKYTPRERSERLFHEALTALQQAVKDAYQWCAKDEPLIVSIEVRCVGDKQSTRTIVHHRRLTKTGTNPADVVDRCVDFPML